MNPKDPSNTRKSDVDEFVFREVQLILSEKQTAQSSMRTGIAVFALPMSVLSVLIATSRLYNVFQVKTYLVALLVLNLALIGLGSYLVIHSLFRLKRLDGLLLEIKRKHSAIAEFLD